MRPSRVVGSGPQPFRDTTDDYPSSTTTTPKHPGLPPSQFHTHRPWSGWSDPRSPDRRQPRFPTDVEHCATGRGPSLKGSRKLRDHSF